MGEVVAVEEVGRKLFQTAARQVYRVDSLGNHLEGGGGEEWRGRERERETQSVTGLSLLHKTLQVYSVCVCVARSRGVKCHSIPNLLRIRE